MIHIFTTICFVAGHLAGQCLLEHKDPLSDDFPTMKECEAFLLEAGIEDHVLREKTAEMRFRCVEDII